MAEEKKTEHKKIKVVKVNPPRKVGDRYEVVEFKGEDNVLYEVWSKTLVAELKEGIEIEVDIVHTVNETDRGTFHHHKITQIYKGGEPVKAKGRGQYGKSPEELELSRRSFALSYAKDLVVANKISPENLLAKADEFYNWLGPQTREMSAIAPIKIKAIEPAKGKPVATPPEVETNPPLKNLGEFFRACYQNFGMTQSKVLKELGGISKEDIGDLDNAYAQVKYNYEETKGKTKGGLTIK